MIITQIARPALGLSMLLLLAGCQSVSLEDAAPKSVPASVDTASIGSDGVASDSVAAENSPAHDVVAVTGEPQTAAAVDDSVSEPTVLRRNPGFKSIIPIEKITPVDKREFVETGARRTGEYPIIGRKQNAANSQMSAAEKRAAEAEMAALLRERANTPDARAEYAARLKELRALALSHAADAQREIEN